MLFLHFSIGRSYKRLVEFSDRINFMCPPFTTCLWVVEKISVDSYRLVFCIMLENVGRECFVGKYDINANGFSVNTVYVSRLYESLRINFN